ncbi:hypothetical protein [Rheinheimera pleomorphica]|nr:hypothetical protein [Rheinheimera pleomorphica]
MKELNNFEIENVSGASRELGREVGRALRDAYDAAVEATTDFFEWALS